MLFIPQDIDSKYRFITLAAQRCDQLMRGAKPRVTTRFLKPTTIAQEEVIAGLVELRSADEMKAAPSPAAETEAPALVAADASTD